VTRHPELPDDEDVERSAQRTRHLITNRDTTPRQRQNDDIVPSCELLKTIGERSAGLAPIGKATMPSLFLPLHGSAKVQSRCLKRP
jgi:hypothetical protein